MNTQKDIKTKTVSVPRELTSTCEFCAVRGSMGTPLFKERYGVDQVVSITGMAKTFTAMQDIVPLGKDGAHLLIIPTDGNHTISLARLKDHAELRESVDAVFAFLKDVFPRDNVFVFEHGAGYIENQPIACGGCHMDHAHGHALVVSSDVAFSDVRLAVEEALRSNGWDDASGRGIERQSVFEDLHSIAGDKPYVHIGIVTSGGSSESVTYVQERIDEYVESQLLRRVISRLAYGEADTSYWHWRDITAGLTTDERMHEISESVQRFRSLLRK